MNFPHDNEDFRSFLNAFRQVAMSDREPVYFTKIRNIISKYASDEVRTELREMKKSIVPLLDGRRNFMKVGRVGADGRETMLTTYEVLDALVNADISHSAAEHEETVRSLQSSHPPYHLSPLIHFLIMPILNACVYLFHLIHAEGLLADEDYPTECGPSEPPNAE